MFDTDELLPDYDAAPSFIQWTTTYDNILCSTEDTIYSCQRAHLGGSTLILYTDKATGITLPLCGRPECLHNDSNCNAYVTCANGLSVYDGKLYWLGSGNKITRANLDGTSRELVTTAYGSSFVGGRPITAYTAVFHRGYFYLGGSTHEVVVDGVPMGYYTISATPLDGSAGFTILDRYVDGRGPETLIKPVGNDLYIMLYYFDYADEEKKEGSYQTVEFYRWDTKTRQVEFIASTQSTPGGMKYQAWSFNPIPGDGIYFQAYYSATDREDMPDSIIYKYSFETGTFEEGARINECMWLSYCKDFIITDQLMDQGLSVCTYDYDGSLLYKSDPLEGHSISNFMGADDEFAYYSSITDKDYVAIPLNGGDYIPIKAPLIINKKG